VTAVEHEPPFVHVHGFAAVPEVGVVEDWATKKPFDCTCKFPVTW